MSKKTKNYLYGAYYVKTDIGRVRMTNEDKAGALTNERGNILLVVCDGMGGQNKGEYASKLALDYLENAFKEKSRFRFSFSPRTWLYRTIRNANKIIFEESQKNPIYKGMGTTLTAALILNDTYFVAQIGDSRLYALQNGKLEQISEDQTYVQFLYRTGKIKEEEILTHPKRHVLMNSLGTLPSLEVDIKQYKYQNQTFLVCSDGLYNNVNKKEMKAILDGSDSTVQKVNELISLANANGGSDNIAVVLWEALK